MRCDDMEQFHQWFDRRTAAIRYRRTVVPVDELSRWAVDPATGHLGHATGRFFSVAGLRVENPHRSPRPWTQPIILQPERGLLAILVQRRDGGVYALMQAKVEPGNINGLQLSPTVQATQSNMARVHGGRAVPYLEWFEGPIRDRVLTDSLQSEQASWFLAKRNRNVVVEVPEDIDVPVADDFCWISWSVLADLFRVPNLMNMDSRTVLGCVAGGMREACGLQSADESFENSWAPASRSRHSLPEVLSRFTEAKALCRMRREVCRLDALGEWEMRDGALRHVPERHFAVIGIHIETAGREVAEWQQPMFAPTGRGVIAFLATEFDGVAHVLVQFRAETGSPDQVEIAPTVQCQPTAYLHLPDSQRPDYLDMVIRADADDAMIDVVQSEEGGRLFHAENRYVVARVAPDIPVAEWHMWVTMGQLQEIVRFGGHINVEGRVLMALLAFEDGGGRVMESVDVGRVRAGAV